MNLQVFNVEHGACAMLTDDYNRRIMIDCGHNATAGWMPGSALIRAGIDRIEGLFVTNYDEDHVSGIIDLFGKVHVPRIWRNASVAPSLIRSLKSTDGMGDGIKFLVTTLEAWAKTGVSVPIAQLGLANVEIQTFANTPQQFDDENNLSMAVVIKAAGVKFLFTGDLEKAGWLALLARADFRAAIADTEVLFASHHGRESGCCEQVFSYFRPRFVVISDKAKGFQTQETTGWYGYYARGGSVIGETGERKVLTTRSDGNISFDIQATQYYVRKF